jgi:hypothetical protein
MKTNLKRRDFIIKSACAGISCCIFMAGSKLSELNGMPIPEEEKPDPEKLNYCGYQCPTDCQFLKGTLENDKKLKKKAYQSWEIKKRFGVNFSEKDIYCYGCKTKNKPEGVVLIHCTVRSCAISKGFNCCIECEELTGCDKDLWQRFPDFKKTVIDMQKQYNS